MQMAGQLQPIHVKSLLDEELVIAQRQEPIVDPRAEEIAEMREQTLFRGTGFLQVTTQYTRMSANIHHSEVIVVRSALTQTQHKPSVDTE